MTFIPEMPGPGRVVRVRQRLYLVEEAIRPSDPVDASLVRLSCLDDDAQGQSLDVLWEKEVDPEILAGEAWERLAERGFDESRLFSAYLHTLRWNCVTATTPRLFQSPFRAGIRLDAYQLEPLRKALMLPRVNLFIADDVGLGKTIEAGLIARELLLRKKVREIVVSCPPSMISQWQEELEIRFGLTFTVIDREYISRIRQERGFGINPWTTHSRFLISHSLLIDEAYSGTLRDWLGELRPGSLLILDEAHHAAPASGAKYAIDSKITRAVRDLAPRFEHRLFLSATPHNGHSNSFSALLEILDPQRFCRGVPVKGKKVLDDVMVRRLKEDIREIEGGFPKRNVAQIDIDGLPEEAPELALARLLNEYRLLREERLKDESKRKQAAAGLLISGLQQRLLSSIEAFARTLRVHKKTVMKQWAAAQSGETQKSDGKRNLELLFTSVGSDDEHAALSEEDLAVEEDAQVEAATNESVGPLTGVSAESLFKKEQALLDEMTRIADSARHLPDARVRRLLEWIGEHLCPGLKAFGASASSEAPLQWNDTRLIIFTEYDDTRRYLEQQISSAIEGTHRADRRIAVFHGPTPPAERKEIMRAFNADPKNNPLRILIATDAAREGLNLQAHCWNLFHFDVPWNPSRMEQRNGRIDRKLQPRSEVFCHYFVYRQRPEDRILQALVRKTETIRKELGSLSQVLEGRLAETLQKGGIRREQLDRLVEEIDGATMEEERDRIVAEELEETRERQTELKGQIDRLRTRLSESQKWIGLKDEHFLSAISCGLELMGAEPLTRDGGDGSGRFLFPAIDRSAGADPTWADTLDTLRAPRSREQKFWEWRRDSPIRPVVFEDPGTMEGDVVHLHLEHRVVRRLLGRFTAQGFVHHDLSRACLAQTSDAIPRVILLGRLCLYGPHAARLHEEIIAVAARWTDPAIRKGELKVYGRDAEEKTLDLLEDSLLRSDSDLLPEKIRQTLQSSAGRDVTELLPSLTERGEELAEEACRKLADRGAQEAESMRKILEDQKKRVVETAKRYQDPQILMEFDRADIEERRQLESNRRHWEKRLAAIDREMEIEPARIREVYEVKARRIEPVGLAYLWPVTG